MNDLKTRIEALTAERDEAFNQLDSARHSVDVLEHRSAYLRKQLDFVLNARDETFSLMLVRAEAAEARAEAAEARVRELARYIDYALERLDASLFTNAEHQHAKDILRAALNTKGPTDDK